MAWQVEALAAALPQPAHAHVSCAWHGRPRRRLRQAAQAAGRSAAGDADTPPAQRRRTARMVGASGNRLRSGTSLSATSLTLPTSLLVGACTAWPRTAGARGRPRKEGPTCERRQAAPAAAGLLHRPAPLAIWVVHGRPKPPPHRSGGGHVRRGGPGAGRTAAGARRLAPACRSVRSPACLRTVCESPESKCARKGRCGRPSVKRGRAGGADGRRRQQGAEGA